MARAMVLGLPCRLRCRRDPYFARVDLEPLPGWVHLSDAATRAAWGDWSYHVSLSRNTVDEAAWQRLCERWDGVEVVLAIDYITLNGVSVLTVPPSRRTRTPGPSTSRASSAISGATAALGCM